VSKKRRLERLEDRLNLGEKERRIVTIHYAPGRNEKVDLEDFPYEDNEDCKNYQRQIKELEKQESDKQVWIVKLDCKNCKENCKFTGVVIGIGKDKNES